MAATTNQTDSSSSFPPPSCCWNVFLSFRGKDTRKTFTGHLYTALDQAGIRTFKDDPELQRGEEISSELLTAIENSSISIVVFSKKYADSSWCLDELVKILECRRTKGQIVVPVFYDVEPSDVRHQIGSFGQGFEKPKKRFAGDKVAKWQAALTEAANLSGYDLNTDANGHEAKLIQEIVEKVLLELNPKYLNVAEHLVGIDSRIDDINKKLGIGSNDVRFIGIYGMGGVGKTTIAKAIYNRFFDQFESSCFLENVRESSEQHNGILCLQEQLICETLKIKDIKVRNVDNGISLVKDRLRYKRILIVLDDLDQLSQLNSLARYSNWFGAGSRIIITTRYERLLDEVQVDVRYELTELNYYESLELFSWHAFKKSIPSEDFLHISNSIVRYVGGLPLALVVLGSYLFRRTMIEWKSAFEKLVKIPHNQIQKILRISYDALDDNDVKEIFLDIACFFIGRHKDDAIIILDACGFFPTIGISILRERCLLTFDDKNNLRMHNLIRDMGREIVRGESPEKPGKQSRLWCQRDVCHVLEKNKGTKKIKGIILDLSHSEQIHFDTRTFERMKNLRLLEMKNVHLFGSFENLFEELRWFSWQLCSLKCLPSSLRPEKLVSLDISGSEVDILWEGAKSLPNLKMLNVCSSQCLTTTPDFGGVKSLEKLYVSRCTSLLQVHPSIGLLAKLKYLDFSGCYNLKKLPEQLEFMEIKVLKLSEAAIERLPDSIGLLGRLVELDLTNCKNLRNLPSSICNLRSLEILSLHGCSKMEQLPDNLGNMECLRSIYASRTTIDQLPESIGLLNRLVDLYLEGCKQLRNLPSSICNLRSLKLLSLSNCWNLEQIPYSIRFLKNLEILYVDGCNIRIFHQSAISGSSSEGDNPDWIASLSSLTTFSLGGISFRSLPSNLVQLYSLKSLVMQNCTSLLSLPELPPNLKNLDARGCSSMIMLPNLSSLKNLGILVLENCSSLQSLPELPSNLHDLDLTNMSSLQSLPKLPPDLTHLSLSGCTSLQSPPELPRNLGYLDASGCTWLGKLETESILQHLILTGCSELAITCQDSSFPGCSGFGRCNIYLPSRDFPDFFRRQRQGSSISFNIPLIAANNLLGMVVWVVYVNKEKAPIRAIIHNITDGTEWYCWDWPRTSEVHTWWRYQPTPFSIKCGDTIEVSFDRFIEGMHVMVESCGVYLIYKPDIAKFDKDDSKISHDINLAETSSRSKRMKV